MVNTLCSACFVSLVSSQRSQCAFFHLLWMAFVSAKSCKVLSAANLQAKKTQQRPVGLQQHQAFTEEGLSPELACCQFANCLTACVRTELFMLRWQKPAFGIVWCPTKTKKPSAGKLSKSNCPPSFQKQGFFARAVSYGSGALLKSRFYSSTLVVRTPCYLTHPPLPQRMLTTIPILFHMSTHSKFSATSKQRKDQWL